MVWLAVYVGLAVAIGMMASGKGRSGAGWFFLALLISPVLALLFLAVAGESYERKLEIAEMAHRRTIGDSSDRATPPKRGGISAPFATLIIALTILAAFAIGSTYTPQSSVRSPGFQETTTGAAQGTSDVAPQCAASDVTLSKLNVSGPDSIGDLHLTGILRQRCLESIGVQLKWTGFSKGGDVIFSNDFWPASTNNIPSNVDYPFEMVASPATAKTSQVIPIAVSKW